VGLRDLNGVRSSNGKELGAGVGCSLCLGTGGVGGDRDGFLLLDSGPERKKNRRTFGNRT